MIPFTLRVTLCIAVICYFIIILYYLKRRMLELKYTLIWLFAGAVMGLLIFFPELLLVIVKILSIETNMYALFLLCIAFIIAVLMTLTAIVSRQSQKIKILIQEIGMMEKRIRELENSESGSQDKGM